MVLKGISEQDSSQSFAHLLERCKQCVDEYEQSLVDFKTMNAERQHCIFVV